MKPPVKLLTLWQGPLPPWFGQWQQRMRVNARTVAWELIQVGSPAEVNALATRALGTPVRKGSAYALCDLRPMFGRVFADRFRGHGWWGWIDLDVCVGDLDRLLPSLLDAHDVVTTARDYVHGPLTLLRNDDSCLELHDSLEAEGGAFEDVLADPDYWNFDETGFGCPDNPSLTQMVKYRERHGLRVRWDDRCWTATEGTVADGLPGRCCFVGEDRRLLEHPTGRELLAYHFSDKRWRWASQWHADFDSLLEIQERELREAPARRPLPPVPTEETPEWWAARLRRVAGQDQEIHRVCLDCRLEDWQAIQDHTRGLLGELLRPGDWVLDAGCGYGAVAECLPNLADLRYEGVDWCELMVGLAKARNADPRCSFRKEDARDLSKAEDGAYDWAVCRGLEGTWRTSRGNREWNRIRDELLRVAGRVLLIDYSRNHKVLRREDYL